MMMMMKWLKIYILWVEVIPKDLQKTHYYTTTVVFVVVFVVAAAAADIVKFLELL